jgi:hypothetical protein
LKSGSGDHVGRCSSKTPSLKKTLTRRQIEGSKSTCIIGWKLIDDPRN